jgi:hypothetical protein
VFVPYGHDLDRSAVGRGVELEVHRPHGVRRIRGGHGACGRGAEALAPAALRCPQALIAPEPLHLLVVDLPAVGTRVVIRRAKSAAWMALGPVALVTVAGWICSACRGCQGVGISAQSIYTWRRQDRIDKGLLQA